MSEDWIANKINGGEITEYKLEDFEEFRAIIAGAFSKVYKARLRSTKNMYALKIIENNEHINKELVNEGTQDNRPSIQEVAMELKNIIAQNIEINIEDIDNTKTLEILLDNAFGINNVIDLKNDMILFVNNLYSTFSKLFNEGGSVSYIIINFISKHNKTPEEVFNWLFINNDNSKYILLLGLFYNWGIGTDKIDAESFDLFLNAATKGNVIAQYFVGRCYEVGWNTKKSIKEAIEWYNKAIGDECPAAECMLGNYYYKNGEYIRAFKLLESAVKKGNITAMHTLGLCYQKGRGTSANMAEGFKLFEKAAKMGLPSSQYELGQCYESGKGTKVNLEKALDWYQKAAEKDRTYRNDRERVKLRIIKDRD
ncbi:4450_t:CDS:2 [Racocetra fulgida]|uniref:4450_t:CDS:1 n=1 Tax=Racocetra fulgida TaxID=60492 RepID=A0A9N9EFZ5_9GLOM|nr:4450_t:CDS:2 [Racocetra fulgida]